MQTQISLARTHQQTPRILSSQMRSPTPRTPKQTPRTHRLMHPNKTLLAQAHQAQKLIAEICEAEETDNTHPKDSKLPKLFRNLQSAFPDHWSGYWHNNQELRLETNNLGFSVELANSQSKVNTTYSRRWADHLNNVLHYHFDPKE